MIGRNPLREAKQTSHFPKAGETLKQTCKPSKAPIIQPTKKENTSRMNLKPSKITQRQEYQPVPKREATSRSVRPVGKPKAQFVPPQVKQQLFPCKDCGRTFIQNALKRHEKICKKIFLNKRKEFNSAKQRFASKDQLNLFKKFSKPITNQGKVQPRQKDTKPAAMPLWKQQSMAFRLAMKEVRGGKKTEEELEYFKKEKKLVKSSMFKCKFCTRSFNQQAGKRHQAFCAQKAKDMCSKLKRK